MVVTLAALQDGAISNLIVIGFNNEADSFAASRNRFRRRNHLTKPPNLTKSCHAIIFSPSD